MKEFIMSSPTEKMTPGGDERLKRCCYAVAVEFGVT